MFGDHLAISTLIATIPRNHTANMELPKDNNILAASQLTRMPIFFPNFVANAKKSLRLNAVLGEDS